MMTEEHTSVADAPANTTTPAAKTGHRRLIGGLLIGGLLIGGGLAAIGCLLGSGFLPGSTTTTVFVPQATPGSATAELIVAPERLKNAVMCDGVDGITRLIADDGSVAGISLVYKAVDGDLEYVTVHGVEAAHDLYPTAVGSNWCVVTDGPDKGKPVTTAALNAGVYNQGLPKDAKPEERLTVPAGEGTPSAFLCERFRTSDCMLTIKEATAGTATAEAPDVIAGDGTTNPPMGVVFRMLKSIQDTILGLRVDVDALRDDVDMLKKDEQS